jgi:Lipid A 3-O-deacylase (PagL)
MFKLQEALASAGV